MLPKVTLNKFDQYLTLPIFGLYHGRGGLIFLPSCSNDLENNKQIIFSRTSLYLKHPSIFRKLRTSQQFWWVNGWVIFHHTSPPSHYINYLSASVFAFAKTVFVFVILAVRTSPRLSHRPPSYYCLIGNVPLVLSPNLKASIFVFR